MFLLALPPHDTPSSHHSGDLRLPRTRPVRSIVLAAWALLSLAGMLAAGGCQRTGHGAAGGLTSAPSGASGVSRAVEGIRFENIAAAAGLDYTWPREPRPMRNVEAFGRGCAFLDYDNDGKQDILLVGSPHVELYHNLGNGRFEDVTHQVGLDLVQGDWRGVAVGDYDGDGFLDLVLTGLHRLALMKNVGGQRFTDMTTAAGLSPTNNGHWGASAGFMDLDGSNRLALVILNYVIFGPKEPQYCEIIHGLKSGCPPDVYRPEYAELWQNLGNGKFRNVTASSGLTHTHGKCLALAFADSEGSGRMDFYIGNDTVPADFLKNLGHLHFKNVAEQNGTSTDIAGRPMAAMGADWADYDRDGRLDLAVPGFSNESYSIYHNVGHGLFAQAGDQLGISGPTFKPLGFGTKWIDFDNDGWPDLVFANGHVYDNSDRMDPLTPLREPLMLFHNEKGRRFTDLAREMGGDIDRPILGRGLAAGDLDNDGKMDFLVVDYEGSPLLFHNVSASGSHWITLDLRSDSPNRFAYGAEVTARAGKQVWVADVSPASSYLSCSDPRIHFGLGATTMLDSVAIRWSDGSRQIFHSVKADQLLTIREGRTEAAWPA